MDKVTAFKELPILEDNCKLIPFANNYIMFPDGKVYSLRSNKFLKKVKTKGKTPGKYYYTYDLGNHGRHLVTRLIMFVFGKHKYKNIKDMPKITLKNNDLEDLNIKNLSFVTQREINKKYNIVPSEKCYLNNNNQKINKDQIDVVKQLRSENFSLKQIGLKYNTSEMSVHRFIKKYCIENIKN